MVGVLTHEQKQLAFRLRGRGWKLVDIAREIGCTAQMRTPQARSSPSSGIRRMRPSTRSSGSDVLAMWRSPSWSSRDLPRCSA